MTRGMTKIFAGTAGLAALFASDTLSLSNFSSFISQAEARVGRPLTPASAAGVARRQTRRAVAVGTAAAAGAYATRCYVTQNGQVCQ